MPERCLSLISCLSTFYFWNPKDPDDTKTNLKIHLTCRCRVVRIMIQAMSKMLKIKVIWVSEVSRWLTMTSLPFREVLTRSYTTKSHNNGRNPLKIRFYPNFDEIAQIGVRYGAFTKRLQRDPLIISKSLLQTTQETSCNLFSSAVQYF